MKMKYFMGLLFIVSLSYGLEWNSYIGISCYKDVCIEGTPVNYTLVFANTGLDNVTINSITIKDSSGIVFANMFNLNETVVNGTYKTFKFSGVVPPATKGSTVIYDVCYNMKAGERSGVYCDKNKRFWAIKSLKDVECVSDKDCYDGKVCFRTKCYDKKYVPHKENFFVKYIMYVNSVLILGFIGYFIYWMKKQKKGKK